MPPRKVTNTSKESHANGMGARPRSEIDYRQVEELASIGCTDAEIGKIIGFTGEWVSFRQKTDPELRQALVSGRENGKASLRRRQFLLAQEGNATMLIWLGKQRLGQMDDVKRHEFEFKKAMADIEAETLNRIAALTPDEGDAE